MIEAELETIKNKLTDNDIDIKKTEKVLSKIEKKIVSLENKFHSILNEPNKSENSDRSEDSDNSNDSNNIDDILENLSRLESDLIKMDSNNIEKLIDNYINFKTKLEIMQKYAILHKINIFVGATKTGKPKNKTKTQLLKDIQKYILSLNLPKRIISTTNK